MLSPVEFLYSCDGQEIGSDAVDLGAHGRKQAAELLHIRLAGGVVDGGDALGQHGGHNDVGGTGDRRLVQQHVAPLEAGGGTQIIRADYGIVLKRCA